MKQSQIDLLEHSKVKIKILGGYIEKYVNIIANTGYTNRIRLYDLFCGEGLYPSGGHGSPLIMMKAVKDLFDVNKAKNKNLPAIDIHFNDLKKEKTDNVRKAIEDLELHRPEFGKLDFSNEDYQNIIPKLCSEFKYMNDEKAFVFIDPYGYNDVKISHIKAIMQDRKSEVLLFLPTQFMYRFDGKGTPQALQEFIADFTGYDEWKKKRIQNIGEYIVNITEALRDYMGKGFFVDRFTIKKDAQTSYCLFFFSSHIRGFEKMLETKWEIDQEQGSGWNFNQGGYNLFEPIKTNELEHKLEKFLKQKVASNGEIYELCLENGFLPKHATEIFTSWHKRGKLQVINASQKGAFYINYNDYKKAYDKVSFKI